MVLICGEIHKHQLVVGLLENHTDDWTGHRQKFRVQAYCPKFIVLPIVSSKLQIKFKSLHGIIRTGKINLKQESAWVLSCNNRHTIRKCEIWSKLKNNLSDLTFHLGDQIYADRIYWRWWKYLMKVPSENWKYYSSDIKLEYYREYYETWTPISKILSYSSNIMIPDDHEIKDQAEMWPYLMDKFVTAKNSEIGTNLWKQISTSRKSELEKFLFETAYQVCLNLYLGLRLTNRTHFDYFKNINGVSIIMTERISQPFLDKSYKSRFRKFKPNLQPNVLWMGGLPPCPIRPNFWELLIYRYVSDVPDSKYDELFDELFASVENKLILIGGDLHAGTSGWIIPKNFNPKNQLLSARFHVASPVSGFPSAYIPRDSLDSTQKYRVKLDEYRPSDPNAVRINFNPFTSEHVFTPGNFADCWQNALSTGFTFWS